MKKLNRDSFRTYKAPVEEMEVKELGGCVFVRGLTTRELRTAEQAVAKGGNSNIDLLYMQVLCAVVDEDGNKMFKGGDKSILEDLPFSVIQRLAEKVNELTGLGDKPKKNSRRSK